jgi:hypothetical protein
LWEYRLLSLGGALPHHQAEDQLNQAGADGFELVAADGVYLYLKRPAS